MTRTKLLKWAERHHYPFLLLCPDPLMVLHAGSVSWRAFLLESSPEKLALLEARVKYWETKFGPVLKSTVQAGKA